MSNEVIAAPRWDEDQWIAACLHLLRCDIQDNCRFCDRIRLQMKFEDERRKVEL